MFGIKSKFGVYLDPSFDLMAKQNPDLEIITEPFHTLLFSIHLPKIGTIYTWFSGIPACGNEDGGKGVLSRV